MALVIWTAADTQLAKKTFGLTLRGFHPSIPEHEFRSWSAYNANDPDTIPRPASGDVVLVCGTKPLDSLQRAALSPKNRKVTSMREKPLKSLEGGYWLTTYDPGIIASEPHQRDVIDWDVRLAVRLMRTGSLMPEVGTYQWVNSFAHLIARIEAAFEATGRPVPVAMDTETMTLYPWYPERDIVSIAFTLEAGTAEVMYTGPTQDSPVPQDPAIDVHAQLSWLLTSPKVLLRGANLKYDMVWIAEKWGIECTNFKFDSMLVGSLLNENRTNSLNLHAKVYTSLGGYDDPFNAKWDKNHMEAVDQDDLLPYAGGDTDACQQSSDVMKAELLEDGELARFYVTILHPAARAFERIERNGIVIDRHEYEKVSDEAKTAVLDFSKQAIDLLPAVLKHKYRDKIGKAVDDGKNPILPSILKDFFFSKQGLNLKPKMFTEKSREKPPEERIPSTSRAHLTMFHANPAAKEMVGVLSNLNSATKIGSTYCTGFLKHVRPDGRLHPSYMLFHGGFQDDSEDESGTVSGRLAAKEPAIQTLPKKHLKTNAINWAKKLRKCYVAPPGKVILQLDYSQGELRVVACIANEKTMLESYEAGLDLHAVTGAQIADIDLALFMEYKKSEDAKLKAIYDDARDRAKPANFGLLYGMSAEGFVDYAWASYGRLFTLAEAEEIRAKFFELYPGLLGYHEDMKHLAHKFAEVRSPLGRVRHLPHINAWDRSVRAMAERQAINSPVQATLTDMMIWAIALIHDAYPNGEFEMFAVIHDAVYAYVDADKVALRASQAQEIMMSLPFDLVDWEPQLPFPADATMGHNLADLGDIPPLALAA